MTNGINLLSIRMTTPCYSGSLGAFSHEEETVIRAMALIVLSAVPLVAKAHRSRSASPAAQDNQGAAIVSPPKPRKFSVLRDKPVIALWAASATLNFLDNHATEQNNSFGGYEVDPLIKPLLHHLPAPAFYASGQLLVFAEAFASHRMRTSRMPILRRLWWLPLAAQIVANSYGWIHTRHAVQIDRADCPPALIASPSSSCGK